MQKIKQAIDYCEKQKFRLTEPRKKVLNILSETKVAMGAYEILEKISTQDTKVNPPTIYRAIDFWLKHGFVHKIVSLNKYIICTHNHDIQQTTLLICNQCYDVQEICLNLDISKIMNYKKFDPKRILTEISGICERCS